MGASPFKVCSSAGDNPTAFAPNPEPDRFKVIKRWDHRYATVLFVKYLDCTNYEGDKILVFAPALQDVPKYLDPHFSDKGLSPLARFEPTTRGVRLANIFAQSL